MDYAILAAELQTDPLGRGYSTKTDAEVAASLNEVNRLRQEPVPMRKVVRWAARHDGIYALETGAQSGNKDVRKLCKAALLMVNNPHVPDFDIADPELGQMFDGLVSAGILTAAQKADLFAMGVSTVSRAAELGLGVIYPGHVENART